MEQIESNQIIHKINYFIYHHPNLFFRGVPTLFFIYMSYPILFFVWEWLPWIWVCYEIYKKLPNEILDSAVSIFS